MKLESEPEKRCVKESLAMLEILSFLGVKKKSKTFIKEAVIPSILYLNIPEDGVTVEKAVSPNNLLFLYNTKIEDNRYGKN